MTKNGNVIIDDYDADEVTLIVGICGSYPFITNQWNDSGIIL